MVGEDVEAARRQIVVWLQHFGLTSKAVSIDVHTDSERAVGEIIGSSTGRYTFAIRRAAPQQHRSIGSAERTVRELKESFAVLRADLNAQGLDVMFSHENLVMFGRIWLCVGPGPFRLVAWCSGDETQVLLGDLRVVLFW